jgi:hypothetical protein
MLQVAQSMELVVSRERQVLFKYAHYPRLVWPLVVEVAAALQSRAVSSELLQSPRGVLDESDLG